MIQPAVQRADPVFLAILGSMNLSTAVIVTAGQSTKPETDPADLTHAAAYFREHRGEINAFYRPHPAEVPCPTSHRPAIFVQVPLGTLNAPDFADVAVAVTHVALRRSRTRLELSGVDIPLRSDR